MVQVGQTGAVIDDWHMINLLFLNSSHDSEIVWLISTYVHYVWEMVHVKKQQFRLDKFSGYLTFKYKMDQATLPDQLINLHYN